MFQHIMAQKQNHKQALKCVFGSCKELQGADGEYCNKHQPKKGRAKLLDALNRMDELADMSAIDKERYQLEKDYNNLFDFISRS